MSRHCYYYSMPVVRGGRGVHALRRSFASRHTSTLSRKEERSWRRAHALVGHASVLNATGCGSRKDDTVQHGGNNRAQRVTCDVPRATCNVCNASQGLQTHTVRNGTGTATRTSRYSQNSVDTSRSDSQSDLRCTSNWRRHCSRRQRVQLLRDAHWMRKWYSHMPRPSTPQ